MTTINGIPENILLINAQPIDNSKALLHLRETAGQKTVFSLSSDKKVLNLLKSNVLAENKGKIEKVDMQPYESSFKLINWTE